MNRTRFFDRYQLIISIVGASAFILYVVMTLAVSFTSQIIYNDDGLITDIVRNPYLMAFQSISALINAIAFIWFIARAITYRMRVIEESIE